MRKLWLLLLSFYFHLSLSLSLSLSPGELLLLMDISVVFLAITEVALTPQRYLHKKQKQPPSSPNNFVHEKQSNLNSYQLLG